MAMDVEAAIKEADEKTDLFKQHMELIIQQGALLAQLPLEDMLAKLNTAETLAPMLDPTLYHNYLYSGRDKVTKDLLQAAIHFKAVIVKLQEQVKAGKIK